VGALFQRARLNGHVGKVPHTHKKGPDRCRVRSPVFALLLLPLAPLRADVPKGEVKQYHLRQEQIFPGTVRDTGSTSPAVRSQEAGLRLRSPGRHPFHAPAVFTCASRRSETTGRSRSCHAQVEAPARRVGWMPSWVT